MPGAPMLLVRVDQSHPAEDEQNHAERLEPVPGRDDRAEEQDDREAPLPVLHDARSVRCRTHSGDNPEASAIARNDCPSRRASRIALSKVSRASCAFAAALRTGLRLSAMRAP